MKIGLKRTFFPLRMFFPVIAAGIIVTLIYGSFFKTSNEAAANVALFYPANCLGGWKNVDLIAGQPEVRDNNNALYSETNSASLKNSNAQLFCGGFAGEIPEAAKHQKVSLNFSWYIGDEDDQEIKKERDVEEPQMEVISDTQSDPLDTSPEAPAEVIPESQIPDEVIPALEAEPEELPVEETMSEPTAFNMFKHFINTAHAQEGAEETSPVAEEIVVPEIQEMPLPESVDISAESQTQADEGTSSDLETAALSEESFVAPNPSEGAYFEVLYTLNGQDWHTLGFVSRIANDVQIEMPIDLFATVEDLQKVQIALYTVERFDSVPKIYLDALWLEVTYDDVDGGELAPPGTRPGDVIFSETPYQDEKAVVVLRNVELMTLSNVLSEATGSTTKPQASVGSSTPSEPTDISPSASSTNTQSQSLTQFVSTSTLAEIINSTDVLVELWLYASTTDSWSRIADDSIISRNPQVKFESGNIFWVDKNNASVWRYNPRSGGYDALSLSAGETSKLQFRDEAGELRELQFVSSSSTVLMNEIKTPTQSPL
jgi:hypothetical protein